ncbi:hypothetical protein BSZ35_06210 [Salinibacter sp. 10B]|uniref:DinB family protein n=1 Tax=Salinibacter sp. 10B TaxID=1923971 RepID=UPI000CF3762A|nr:DinB family protein [Salinibacter sp. 10B]PQJ34245.1 hypothetical protein BSZ35_06210 [Salinibacter sp. 10B]
MPSDSTLREHVLNLLTARQAHCTFEDAVAQMPSGRRGDRPEALPYSVWELVEHIRRAQQDILVYCQEADYTMPDWPSDFWPDEQAPADDDVWNGALAQVKDDRAALCDLVKNESLDLYDTVPSHDEHTYLREMLLVADHNAYHVGQIVTVRRQLGLWPPSGDHE